MPTTRSSWKSRADHEALQSAAIALIYRELYNARVFSAEEVIEYCEEAPGELGPLPKYAATAVLFEADWFTLRILDEHPGRIATWAEKLHDIDPARGEALLHFWPVESKPPIGAGWTHPYCGRRWDEVELAMIFFEERGLTATRDEIDSVAYKAHVAMGGDPDPDAWTDLMLEIQERAG